jgi:hypothetical protein
MSALPNLLADFSFHDETYHGFARCQGLSKRLKATKDTHVRRQTVSFVALSQESHWAAGKRLAPAGKVGKPKKQPVARCDKARTVGAELL